MYDSIHWTPQKKTYDKVLIGLVGIYLTIFCGLQGWLQPQITAETLVIRATGTLAYLMLHIVLIIGPLCRLDGRFLPLLYNRRHFGVGLFLVGLVHGAFNLVQFHALGNVNPLVSLFVSNTRFGSVSGFPFQVLGFFALLILFLMAATSHDFWLKNLRPRVWKSLHRGVYLAYALLVMHVMLGIVQLEKSPVFIALTGLGMATVIGFHLAAALKKRESAKPRPEIRMPQIPENPTFIFACDLSEIPEKRAKLLKINGESIAIFKYDGKVSAVSNFCKHQNGPLSEGKVIDGCITCPWHGYQYLPENGQSPPPFKEKIATYEVRLDGDKVFVNPMPHPEGTALPPATIGT